MNVEIAVVISVLSLIFTVFQGASAMKRNSKKDTKEDTVQLATVIVKLEDIDRGVKSIQEDMRDVRSDIQQNRERIIKAEESVKQAHKRIDEMIKGVKA